MNTPHPPSTSESRRSIPHETLLAARRAMLRGEYTLALELIDNVKSAARCAMDHGLYGLVESLERRTIQQAWLAGCDEIGGAS